MIQSILDYPVLYIIIIVLIALCLFVWRKAMRASARRNASRDMVIAQLKEYHALRREFANPTPEQMAAAEPNKLIAGLCANVQHQLEESNDPDGLFATLPQAVQTAYALGYLLEDGSEQLSNFFRRNGPPLTTIAQQAAQTLLPTEFAELYTALYAIHNGTAANHAADIPALDSRAHAIMQQASFWKAAHTYFLENAAVFAIKS